MGFLDNSGDIILDAVLTDTGRFRLAKGDGSFKIVKFALADDEINYKLYNKNHASGSAYYDLEILQSPVLEALINNASSMNHKLLSIPRTNLLYLPEIVLSNKKEAGSLMKTQNSGFAIAVTKETAAATVWTSKTDGVQDGENPGNTANQVIRIDQGLNTDEINWQFNIDQDLKETQYIVEIDNRLGTIATPKSPYASAPISFIDDDNIASYFFSLGSDSEYVENIVNAKGWPGKIDDSTRPEVATIKGPQGTCLTFKIRSSLDLISSNFLFTQLGASFTDTTEAEWGLATGNEYKYIDTIVKVTGATTGYKVDIPVRFVKKTA